MRRSETRYKGVWDAGYEAAMREASATFVSAVRAGVAFAAPPDAWNQDQIAYRMNGRIWSVSTEGALVGLADILRRMRHA